MGSRGYLLYEYEIFQSNIFNQAQRKMGLKYHIDPRFNYRQFS